MFEIRKTVCLPDCTCRECERKRFISEIDELRAELDLRNRRIASSLLKHKEDAIKIVDQRHKRDKLLTKLLDAQSTARTLLVLTDAEVAQMLKVSPETHWFRVVHETSRDAAPGAIVRIQAIKRN